MAPGTDPSLPALGTGKYDWRGWLPLNRHPHMVEPRSDILTNWNNKDLRVIEVWPIIGRVLNGGRPPSKLAAQAANLIDRWRSQGASRIDLNLDGRIDAPGAAVMDTAWTGIATAVMRPVLGPLTSNLDQHIPTSSTPSFDPGQFGYVSKDLRTELGLKVRGPYSRRYCGNGMRFVRAPDESNDHDAESTRGHDFEHVAG